MVEIDVVATTTTTIAAISTLTINLVRPLVAMKLKIFIIPVWKLPQQWHFLHIILDDLEHFRPSFPGNKMDICF